MIELGKARGTQRKRFAESGIGESNPRSKGFEPPRNGFRDRFGGRAGLSTSYLYRAEESNTRVIGILSGAGRHSL